MSLAKFLSRKNVDFTKGNNTSNLITFALPIMLGALLQNLYHSADSIVLGNFVGSDALAATIVCGSFTNCLVGFCTGMSVGSTVVVAKSFGAGDLERLKHSIKVNYTFSVVLGIAVSLIGVIITPFILEFSNISDSLHDYAVTYLRICLSGLVFTIVYNNTSGILRAMGDMTSPFLILTGTCLLNIVLDLVFTVCFKLGVAGVAWATVICQFLSVVLSYRILRYKKGFACIDFKECFRYGWSVIGETSKIGFSAGVQGSLISLSNLFVWGYINNFSPSVVAGVGIGHRIDNLMGLPTSGFEAAITTFTSQNIGAKQKERIRSGIKSGIIISTGISVCLSLIVHPLAPYCARIFSNDAKAIEVASRMTRLIMPLYFTNTVRQVLAGVLRAYSYSTQSMLLSLAGMAGVRQLVLALTYRRGQTILDVYLSYPAGWLSAMIFIVVYYLIKRRAFFTDRD